MKVLKYGPMKTGFKAYLKNTGAIEGEGTKNSVCHCRLHCRSYTQPPLASFSLLAKNAVNHTPWKHLIDFGGTEIIRKTWQ